MIRRALAFALATLEEFPDVGRLNDAENMHEVLRHPALLAVGNENPEDMVRELLMKIRQSQHR